MVGYLLRHLLRKKLTWVGGFLGQEIILLNPVTLLLAILMHRSIPFLLVGCVGTECVVGGFLGAIPVGRSALVYSKYEIEARCKISL